MLWMSVCPTFMHVFRLMHFGIIITYHKDQIEFPYISYNVSPNKVFKTMRTPKPEFVSGSPLAQLS